MVAQATRHSYRSSGGRFEYRARNNGFKGGLGDIVLILGGSPYSRLYLGLGDVRRRVARGEA